MNENQKKSWLSGRGYYLALAACAVAIGMSGYLYYRNAPAQPVSQTDDPVMDSQPAVVQQKPDASAPQNQGQNQPEATQPPTQPAKLSTCSPVDGQVTAEYAMECLSFNQTTRDWRVHNGMDIAAEAGSPVLASADGQVYTVYDDEELGTTVVIRHENGYVTKYASLSAEVAVTPGQQVSMGEKIGAVGTTALMESALGDHVHFSVTKNNESMDPAEFLEE